MSEQGAPGAELPEDLADRAGLQLMAAEGAERAAVLTALVAAHPQHEQALRRLLADLDRVDGVLASSYPMRGDDRRAEALDHVGGHRVIRRLGEGAFGVVYLCAQERPVTRMVAVKVVRPGADGAETLRRFAAEQQLLANLNHPAITQVFDAGALPDGRPFFVMEYVDGAPIRDYCDSKGLPVRDRLRLFGEVCKGVAHAHARGILHRDLKPANVLVVDSDAGPLPKIIDFGIGKPLVAAHGDGGPETEAGRVVGTPGYMSPEQAAGRVDQVDARADVFALGVILYEMLTGGLPWAEGAAATTAAPLRPSARVATMVAAGADAKLARRRQLAAELRGDLDWITLRALARERADRYPTVVAFAADVQRHLRGDTVSVGPPSLRYRLGKFLRRNRGAVLVAGGALLVLAAAGALFYVRTTDAESVAERALAQATAAVERLVARAGDDRLRQAPEHDLMRQMLAQDALGFYEQWLRERPLERRLRIGRSRALVSLSGVHWQLGQIADAERTATEAVAECRELFAQTPEDLAVRSLLADALRRNGRALVLARRIQEAVVLFADATAHLEQCHRAAPKDHALSLASACRELGTTRQAVGQAGAGLEAMRRSVSVLEQAIQSGQAPPQAHTDVALPREALVEHLLAVGRVDEAAGVADAAEAGLTAVTLDVHRVTARVCASRAQLARQRHDWSAAIDHAALAVAAGERWQRQEPGRLLPREILIGDLDDLAESCEQAARWTEADAAWRRAIEVADAMVTDFASDVSQLARLEGLLHRSAFRLYERLRLPDLEQAQAWMQRALDIQAVLAKQGTAPHRPRSQTLTTLAMIVEARGQAADATWEQVAAELPVDVDVTTPNHEFDCAGWLGVATSRLRHGQPDGAATALRQAERWVGDPPQHASQAGDVEWLRARIALQRGDVGSAIAAAGRIVIVRPTWMGRWCAADCYLAASHLAAAPAGHADAATVPREQAARLYRQVIDELAEDVRSDPDDPWHVVPWGFASLQLAQIEMACGRPAAARELLDPALSGLDRIAPLAHRDLWQPETLERAKALHASLRSLRGH